MNKLSDFQQNIVGRIQAIIVVVIMLISLMLFAACGMPSANTDNDNPDTDVGMVTMRDGVKLATDVYLPEGKGPFPAILFRTPYNKDGDKGPIYLLAYGIAIVVQDNRGCHASKGEYAAYSTDGIDAYDTVRWMETQSWFNGKYATYGNSARGITQYMQVPYLDDIVAQYIEVATPEIYTQGLFQGGAPRKMLVENWLNLIGHGDYYPNIFKEISSVGTYAAPYSLKTTDYARVNWPSIHLGGWYDCFGQGIIDGFTGYQYGGAQPGKAKLIMGPWTHAIGGRNVGNLVFPENSTKIHYYSDLFNAMFAEQLLGSTEYGNYRDFPNVGYYVMGDTKNTSPLWNQWATSDVWPLPHSDTSYYLQNDGSLSTAKPLSRRDFGYQFDPSKPIKTMGGANLLEANRGSFDQRSVEDGRNDIVSFDIPIDEPLLITGRILAKLYVSSDCVDTDFTVKLMDVYPDGSAWNIADGIIRMRYRNGMAEQQFMDGTGATVYEALVDLWSSSYYFNKGHKLKISISSSNYPRFDLNPNTGAKITPTNDSTTYRIANNKIIVSPDYPSAIILPIPNSEPNYITTTK